MKKDFLKRIATIVFAVVLLVTATACGEDSTNPTKNNNSETSNSNEEKIKYNTPASTVGVNGKDYKDYDPYAGIEQYKGTTVKFATWIDHTGTEGGVPIKSFEEKYDINVDLVYCSQDNYASEILALIASNNAPDVYVENGNFPTLLQVAQDFSVTGIDLNEPIWSQKYINACTVNGKVYAVNTVNSLWSSAYVVVFNRELMESNGIKTPTEYLAEGNWTWETMKTCAQQVNALGASYKGIYYETNCMLASAGTGSIKYDYKNSKFINNTSDPILADALQKLATLKSELLVGTQNAFVDGLVGMAVKDVYGLKKTGYWRNMDSLDLGVVQMPAFDENTPAKPGSLLRAYGIVRGSKNPKAAGLFIRYFLDPANYDLEDTFISTEAGNSYFELCDYMHTTTEEINFYFYGPNEIVGSGYGAMQGDDISSPAQVATGLATLNNSVQNAVNKANEVLKGIK